MAELNGKTGVWRTIGGRRIFIRDGEDLGSAMKNSGKFKTKVDKNDINALNKIADSGADINKYDGLDDIAKDYIKNRRQEISQKQFTENADKIHKESIEKLTRNLDDGKEIHDVFRQMDYREMDAFAKAYPESIEKMKAYLSYNKNKEFPNTRDYTLVDEDYNAYRRRLEQVEYKINDDRLDSMQQADYKKERNNIKMEMQRLDEERNRAIKNEYNQYRKEHPNTELTYEEYKKIKRGY